MPDKYPESSGSILAASPDREALLSYSEDLKQAAHQSGGEFTGPIKLPVAKTSEIRRFLENIKESNAEESMNNDFSQNWLFGLVNSQEDIDELTTAVDEDLVYWARRYDVSGEQAIQAVFQTEAPESVLIAAELGHTNHPKYFGHNPYTYDPNIDYVTEL